MDRKSGSAREKSYDRPENADAERRTGNKTPRKIARKSRIVIAHVTIDGDSRSRVYAQRERARIRADRMSCGVHKRTSTKGGEIGRREKEREADKGDSERG